MYVTAIIAAGGRGRRLGGERPKQLLQVGGREILERSVAAFLAHPAVHEVVVALPPDLVDDPPAYLRPAARRPAQDIPGVSGDGDAVLDGSGKPLRIVAGGVRRQDSVTNAFAATAARSDIIVIHDAARPFASADLIARTIAAAAETGAAVAAVQARDTVKETASGPAHAPHYVRRTLPREEIYLAQTPQAFRRDVLRAALALTTDATDEAMLAEQAGHVVRIVEGEATNIKITTPDDLAMAEMFASSLRIADCGLRIDAAVSSGEDQSALKDQSAIRDPQSTISRVGVGYDLHRLVEGRPLILGGVTIPFERGLKGHSDADVVSHAVTDAVLGAAAAGDIGRHFPDTDPQWEGASSIDLLKRAAAIVRTRGFDVGNVDVSVIAERPKLAPYIDAMCANVARALGIPADRVSIKGKTNEGVDALGRGEAIAVHAIALMRSRV